MRKVSETSSFFLKSRTNIHFNFKSYAIVNNISQPVYRNNRLKSFNVSNTFSVNKMVY